MSTHLYDISSLACLGLSEEEATAKLKEQGWIVRTIVRDDEVIAITEELRGDRVNLEVKNGKVFEISVG